MKNKISMNAQIIWAFFLLIYLPGCIGQKVSPNKKQNPDTQAVDQVQIIEAKCQDIPHALQADPLVEYCFQDEDDPQKMTLGYKSQLDKEQLITYYQHEMERLGWQETSMISARESLLIFEKPNPDRLCTVSIRPHKKTSDIIIFCGLKEQFS